MNGSSGSKPISGAKGWTALFITAILSGTGGGIVIPQVAPNIYRPHPFSSLDWEREEEKWRNRHAKLELEMGEKLKDQKTWILQMQRQILAMTALVQTVAEYGPREVRATLGEMEATQLRYHEIAVSERAAIAKQQVTHNLRRAQPHNPWRPR